MASFTGVGTAATIGECHRAAAESIVEYCRELWDGSFAERHGAAVSIVGHWTWPECRLGLGILLAHNFVCRSSSIL